MLADIDIARAAGYSFHSAKIGADVDADVESMRILDARMAPGELRIVETGACEVVGLKIGRVGGLTVAAAIRDRGVEAGISMNLEDTGGTALAATAAVQLAQATPAPFRRATWLGFAHLTTNPIDGGVANDAGWTTAPDGPGIGAAPVDRALGDPVAVYTMDAL